MRYPQIFRWTCVLSAVCVAPASVFAQSGFPGAPAKKKEEKKEVRFEVVKAKTNLDDEQQEQAARLDKMFIKLYGLEELPDPAKELVRDAIFGTLDGYHQPERERTDKLTDELAAVLQAKDLAAAYAVKIIRGAAELLSEDEMSKEEFDGLMVDIEQYLAGSRMTTERHQNIKTQISDIIMNAKLNDAKVEAREKARKAEEERAEKERLKKIEEAKKKAKRQNRGMGAEGRGTSR